MAGGGGFKQVLHSPTVYSFVATLHSAYMLQVHLAFLCQRQSTTKVSCRDHLNLFHNCCRWHAPVAPKTSHHLNLRHNCCRWHALVAPKTSHDLMYGTMCVERSHRTPSTGLLFSKSEENAATGCRLKSSSLFFLQCRYRIIPWAGKLVRRGFPENLSDHSYTVYIRRCNAAISHGCILIGTCDLTPGSRACAVTCLT